MSRVKTPKKVVIYSNGNFSCWDENGEQIPELQTASWFSMIMDFLERKGVNVMDIEKIEANVNGRNVVIEPFMTTENGWSYEIKPDHEF